ncbi:MAG: HdeD family acid-resistance protein, partial [Acidimicrobiia bacterium]|nr:HdeD family acid-resistance protein [Acidimicrobiia bacterium]
GLALFARPTIGALSLAVTFGVFALAYGVSQIVLGAKARTTDKVVGQALSHAV